MDIASIFDKLSGLGVSVTIVGDKVRLEPGSLVPPELVEELRQHKQEVILRLKGCRLKYPDAQATREELEEIVEQVHGEGYVLLWSTVLQDLVAFYRDEEARGNIPPGFVPYSEAELWELFGDGNAGLSPESLRLIHEAKKHGGHVTSQEAHPDEEGR